LTLDGWKEKSAERFLKSIQESRNVPFERVLYALGIRHVGETTAKSVAKHFGNIDAIAQADLQTLLGVDDIGEIIAESIYTYFRKPENLEIISRLKASGLRFELGEQKAGLSSALEGMTIVISGNFTISRDQMKEIIALHGGKNSSSISGKTTYLLAGEKAGPEKLKKAEALGVAVIDEDTFRGLLGQRSDIPQTETHEDKKDGIQLTLF